MKRIMIFGLVFLFIISSQNVLGALNSTDVQNYYKADNNTGNYLWDSAGSGNLYKYGSPTIVNGKINNGTYTSNGINYYNGTIYDLNTNSNKFTINFWANTTSWDYPTGTNRPIMVYVIDGGSYGFIEFSGRETGYGCTSATIGLKVKVGTGADANCYEDGNSTETNQFIMITLVSDGTNIYLYKNANLIDSGAQGSYGNFKNAIYVGSFVANYDMDYVIDELSIFNINISTSDISQLYNNGTGFQYPFTPPPPAFNISGYVYNNSIGINNSNVWILNTTGGLITSTTTDSSGYYFYQGLQNNTFYRLLAYKNLDSKSSYINVTTFESSVDFDFYTQTTISNIKTCQFGIGSIALSSITGCS